MKRILSVVIAGMFGACSAWAQVQTGAQSSAAAQSKTSVASGQSSSQGSASGSASTSASAGASAGQNSLALSDGTTMNASLAGSLDAKKNKPGDRVEARTTQDVKQDGKVVLKKGTRLAGHVTQAQARTKQQSESELGVAFDHAILRDGTQVPINITIQALASAQSSAAASMDDGAMAGADAMGSGAGSARATGGGLVGGVASTASGATGSVVNTASSAAGSVSGAVASTSSATAGVAGTTSSVGGLNAAGHLMSNSSGVFGLQGLSLNSGVSSAAQGSLILSSTRNVHLDSGTQMVLRVAGQAR